MLLILDIFLLISVVVVSLLLSNYRNKVAFQILAAVGLPLTSLPLVALIACLAFYQRAYREYSAMLEEEPKTMVGEVISVGEKPITLADSSRVHAIRVRFEEGIRCLYLSTLFECPFELGKTYRFQVAFDYIRGYDE